MRQGQSSEGPSLARWTIGIDESGTDSAALYSDNRGVSRVYEMSSTEGLWQLWRTAPGFSQRFAGRISPDRKTILAYWEKSFDGVAGEHDFDISYSRLYDCKDSKTTPFDPLQPAFDQDLARTSRAGAVPATVAPSSGSSSRGSFQWPVGLDHGS